jgi:hypothetical protein
MTDQRTRRRLAHGIGALTLALSLGLLIAFGIAHLARTHGPGWDLVYFQAAGQSWIEGHTPYGSDFYKTRVQANAPHEQPDLFFAYPPASAPLMMGLAALPDGSRWAIWTAINLALTLTLAWLLARWLARRDTGTGFLAALGPWLAGAFVLASPYTWDAFSLGQTMPLVLLTLVAGWQATTRGNPWAGGALIGLAAIKPTVVVLPVLWLVLDKHWRAVVAAGAMTLALSAYPMLLHGPIEPVTGWLAQIQAYEAASFNHYGSDDVIGLTSFIAAIGGPVLSPTLVLAGLALALVALHRLCPPKRSMDVLALLLVLFAGLVYAHRYDLMMISVTAAVIWPYVRTSAWRLGASGALLALVWLPERIVMALGPVPPLLLHYRSLALGIATLLIAFWLVRDGAPRPALNMRTVVSAPEPTAPLPQE